MSNPNQPQSTQTTEASTAPQYTFQPKRRQLHFSMHFKLTTAFLAVALIPLASYVYANYLSMQSLFIEVTGKTLNQSAINLATNLDDFMNANQQLISQVAVWPEVVNYLTQEAAQTPPSGDDQQRLQQILYRLKAQNELGDYSSYALLNTNGRNVMDSAYTNFNKDESGQDYFKKPLEVGQSYVSPVIFDSPSWEGALYFSHPVRSPDGKIVGVLRLRYNAEVLQKLIRQYNNLAGTSSFAILLDENHLQLAHGTLPDLRFKSIMPLAADTMANLKAAQRLPDLPDRNLSLNLPTFEQGLQDIDNQTYSSAPYFTAALDESGQNIAAVAVARMKTQPWFVAYTQSQDALSQPLREQSFTFGAIVAGIILLVVIMAVNISRWLSGPLKRLSIVAQQVAGGALGLHVPVESRDEVGQLARYFNSLAAQLSDVSAGIDKTITERTRALGNIVRALETSTHIGRQINTILKIDDLLRYVVNRIQVEFSLYHTQIYLVEEQTNDLVMVEGSGEIGRQLKAQGHRLKAGEGIVGTVASSNEFFISNDVSKALNFVANPLLPNTHSELALPLRKGNRVIGVLDLQSDKFNRFISADVSLMQTIANQTATALENARLLTEAQAALKEVERLNARLTREGWDQFGTEVTTPGYRFSGGNSIPLHSEADVWLPPMKRAASEKQLVKQTNAANGDNTAAELAVPLVLRGEVIGVLGIKRDTTTDWQEEEVAAVEAVASQVTQALENARLSKEAEKTIAQLKEIDRLQREFLTSMSHELRTPLNSIIGFADVILQGIDGEVSDMALNDIRLIYNSGQHLLALINDVLDLAKIEAGKMELVREPLDLEDTVKDVLAGATSLSKGKSVDIITDIQPDLPAIYADRLRFNQILLNLVSNAVKFTEKGTITIRANIWSEDSNYALVSVIDQGIGIPPQLLDAVFDRFRQVDNVATRKTGGTGLGLPICKQLIELHGGKIKVTSRMGQGSDFHFTIPFVNVLANPESVMMAQTET